MTPAIEVEASLPEPRPLDTTGAASRRQAASGNADGDGIIVDVTAGEGEVNETNSNNAANALKLADCIGRVSAALAELGATVEALKGEWFEASELNRYFLEKASGGRDDSYRFQENGMRVVKRSKRRIGRSREFSLIPLSLLFLDLLRSQLSFLFLTCAELRSSKATRNRFTRQ